MGSARSAGVGNLDLYYKKQQEERKRREQEKAKQIVKKVGHAVENGVRVTFSSEPQKGETEVAKALRRAVKRF